MWIVARDDLRSNNRWRNVMTDRKVFADSVTPLPDQPGLTPHGLMIHAEKPTDRNEKMTLSRGVLTPGLEFSRNSENSKANRIDTMKGPAESGQICSVGRRKIAKKIAKNKRCYANTLRPRSRMLLKVMKGG